MVANIRNSHLFDTIWSGFRPGPLRPKDWYDRAIRVVADYLFY